MSYNQLLKNIVANTNYTQKEICELCKSKYGVTISREYFSRLLNNKCPPPSEDISRTIAKVCNADERLLVIEGYISNAPKEIKDFINQLKSIQLYEINRVLENEIDKDTFYKTIKELEKEPYSSFIINFLNMENNLIHIDKNNLSINTGEDIVFNLYYNQGIKVEDDSMYPLIQMNDNICLLIENNYNNGEIVALKKNNRDKILIRQLYNYGNSYIFTALNKKYEQITVKKTDITILGKVSKIIKNL